MEKRRIRNTKKELLSAEGNLLNATTFEEKKKAKAELFSIFKEWYICKLLSYCHKKNFRMSDEQIEDWSTELALHSMKRWNTDPNFFSEYPTTYFHLYSFIGLFLKQSKDALDHSLQDYSIDDFENILTTEEPTDTISFQIHCNNCNKEVLVTWQKATLADAVCPKCGCKLAK